MKDKPTEGLIQRQGLMKNSISNYRSMNSIPMLNLDQNNGLQRQQRSIKTEQDTDTLCYVNKNREKDYKYHKMNQ